VTVGGQRRWYAVALAGVAVLLGACGGQGSVEDSGAADAATTFSRSVASRTQAACDLLAPSTLDELEATSGPCADSLPDEVRPSSGPARSTEVYGKDAIVHLGSDTVFLARFRDGWRVTAAGCTEQGEGRPYDCKVKGS
jgi:hypothetical protein